MTTQLLPDIERGKTWTVTHRNRCLVRQVLRWKAEGNRAAVGLIESSPFYPQISGAVQTQWARGNRGEKGDWR